MARQKAHTPKEIVAELRQEEVLVGQRKTVAEAARAIGVTEPTYYRWRTEFGGLKLDQVRPEGAGAGECPASKGEAGPDARERRPEGSRVEKMVSLARPWAYIERVVHEIGVSEHKACMVLGQHRSTQRTVPRAEDEALTADIVALAKRYGRFDYQRITDAGWAVNLTMS